MLCHDGFPCMKKANFRCQTVCELILSVVGGVSENQLETQKMNEKKKKKKGLTQFVIPIYGGHQTSKETCWKTYSLYIIRLEAKSFMCATHWNICQTKWNFISRGDLPYFKFGAKL